MATARDVSFEFQCYGKASGTKLSYTYQLPANLIGPDAELAPDFAERFVAAITPIMDRHQADCVRESSRKCAFCGGPTVKALQTPNSYLRVEERPLIWIVVTPICDSPQCEISGRKAVAELLSESAKQASEVTEPDSSLEMPCCAICKKVDGVKRCSGCRAVGYCSRECQKKGWKRHKTVCIGGD